METWAGLVDVTSGRDVDEGGNDKLFEKFNDMNLPKSSSKCEIIYQLSYPSFINTSNLLHIYYKYKMVSVLLNYFLFYVLYRS